MLKHRKRLLLVSALLVRAVGVVFVLLPRNEPKYKGRYLSDWLGDFADPEPSGRVAAKEAVEQIGTNGLPMLMAWISTETPPWKTSLHQKLPLRLAQNEAIGNWLGRKDFERAALGMHGISVLGANAASAIPALTSLMQTRTNIVGRLAITALTSIGPPSVPALRDAFADTNQHRRTAMLWSLRWIAFGGHTNECMPTITSALDDRDAQVRSYARNLLQVKDADELRQIGR